jgi:hypothetical protein
MRQAPVVRDLALRRPLRPAVPTADVGTGAAKMRCNLNSSVLRDDAVGFRVVDEYGREVLTSSLI